MHYQEPALWNSFRLDLKSESKPGAFKSGGVILLAGEM